MPIKLVIPYPNEKNISTKDLIFSILSQDHPLKLNEIFRNIRKRHSFSVTYQGVRKAVDSLTKEKVLVKENKSYELNREWITYARTFLQNLEKSYFLQTKSNVETITSSKDYKEYRFTSLYELDLFWTEIIMHWSERLEKDEEKTITANVGHLWWMLINLGNETKLNTSLIKKGIKFYISSWYKFPLDKWALNINKKMGVHAKTIRKRPKEYVDMNVLGDYIIQINYPENIIKKLDDFYKKYKNIDDINSLEISNICHDKTEIIFKYFRDPTIAKTLRLDILKNF